MSATNDVENALLELIFKGTTWANMADNAAGTPATTFYISLHTATPGEAGSQTSSEAAYTGYARVAVVRTASGWTVSGSAAVNTAEIVFGECTASPGSPIRYAGLGLSSSGSGRLLLFSPLAEAIEMVEGTIPVFAEGQLRFTVD